MKIIIEETSGTTVTIIEQFTKVSISDSVKFLELTDVYDKSFEGKNGFVPTVNETSGKLELKAPTGGGGGSVTADQVTETDTRVFVTPSEKTAITHANRSILDTIEQAFTTVLKSAYDGVVSGFSALVATGERLITSGEIAKLLNLSGTNTGDETTITIQTKRPLKTVNSKSLEGSGNVDITKSDVGLGNVDNTSDLNKPISTETQTALNLKADKADFQELLSTYTLSNTALAQSMNLSHNVVAGTYEFLIICEFSGLPNGNLRFGILGSASISKIRAYSQAVKNNTLSTQGGNINSINLTNVTTSLTSTVAIMEVKGVATFSSSGTFIPACGFSQIPTSAKVLANSFSLLKKIS